MGHKDSLTIADAGLPIPKEVQRIDLALSQGIPKFVEVLKTILEELEIEKIILAQEIREKSPELHQKILQQIKKLEKGERQIEIVYLPHEEFKKRTKDTRAVIRTGEFTPYANVILVSGVLF